MPQLQKMKLPGTGFPADTPEKEVVNRNAAVILQ